MKEFLQIVQNTSLSTPTYEVMLLLTILTLCLLFRLSRVGLITAYLFCYRWGWLSLHDAAGKSNDRLENFIRFYIILGVLVLVLSIASMFHASHSE